MSINQLAEQIDQFRDRLAILQQRIDEATLSPSQLLTQAFEELQNAIEELETAQEQLCQQNDQIYEQNLQLESVCQVATEEQKRYQDLFEFAPNAYLVTDAAGVIEEANHAASILLNISPQFLIGKPLVVFIPSENRAAFHTQLINGRSGEWVKEWETRLQPRQSEPIDAALSVGTICDAEGRLIGLRWLLRDISPRKRIEALYTSEQAFRTLAENALDIIFRIDREFRYTYINPAIAKATGIPPRTFISKTAADIGFPVETNSWNDTLQQVFTTGQERFLDFQYPTDRQICYYQTHFMPEFAPDGSVSSVLGISRDVTEYKLTEQALRESESRLKEKEQQYRLLAHHFPNGGVFLFDRELRYLIADGEAVRASGFKSEQIEGKTIWEALPKDVVHLRAPIFQAALAGEETFEEISYNGRTHALHAIPVKNEQGEVIAGMVVSQDVTEHKLAEAERDRLLALEQKARAVSEAARSAAETANQVKDEFLAVLSHELRSPLNAILGWAQMLRTRKFSEAAKTKAIETIERNARLQTQLIEDLLDVSRILRGKLSLNTGKVNLISIVEAAIETTRLSAEAKGINLQLVILDSESENIKINSRFSEDERLLLTLKSQIKPTQFLVLGDPNRLQQVFWNLLSNAIKFTPVNGQVEVILSVVMLPSPEFNQISINNYIQIAISDTGIGIEPDFIPYVFEYFRQGDGSITRKHGGLGLGLAIVRNLVELHGGTVEAKSEGKDKGTTFIVKIPLFQNEKAEIKDEISTSFPTILNGKTSSTKLYTPSLSLKKLQILVVDDDIDSREFVTIALEQEGATVKTAASVSDAISILEQFQPDLLISDIGMPDEDGYSFIRKLRKIETTSQKAQIPALALTAYARNEDRDKALAAGFQQHLSKPVNPEELVNAILLIVDS